jgi:hypothetical protein
MKPFYNTINQSARDEGEALLARFPGSSAADLPASPKAASGLEFQLDVLSTQLGTAEAALFDLTRALAPVTLSADESTSAPEAAYIREASVASDAIRYHALRLEVLTSRLRALQASLDL